MTSSLDIFGHCYEIVWQKNSRLRGHRRKFNQIRLHDILTTCIQHTIYPILSKAHGEESWLHSHVDTKSLQGLLGRGLLRNSLLWIGSGAFDISGHCHEAKVGYQAMSTEHPAVQPTLAFNKPLKRVRRTGGGFHPTQGVGPLLGLKICDAGERAVNTTGWQHNRLLLAIVQLN
jgi:hypothetical protein